MKDKTILPRQEQLDATFYEIVRRVPQPIMATIEAQLKLVTPLEISRLILTMDYQQCLLEDDSFIHEEKFPFVTLQAVREGQISPLQFGSLMTLWGSLETIIPKPEEEEREKPIFMPLFTDEGTVNGEAAYLLERSLQHSPKFPYLVTKTPERLVQEIYEKATHIPQSERGFWLVEPTTSKPEIRETITQHIKSIGVKFLATDKDSLLEMIPSFGLRQLFLDVAFPHAVRLNPVIGISSPVDIREGSVKRYRDIALPFPENELPKVADTNPAPSALDFEFHDFYHATRASRVNPKETEYNIAIGDQLEIIQKGYDKVLTEFSERHNLHRRLLPVFGEAIKKLPAQKQRKATERAFEKFNEEIRIIHTATKSSEALLQLKLRLWDMERGVSGTGCDEPEKTAYLELVQIIGSIINDFKLLGERRKAVQSKCSARRIAQAVLDVVKPEASTLKTIQEKLSKNGARHYQLFKRPVPSKAQIEFEEAIINAQTTNSH